MSETVKEARSLLEQHRERLERDRNRISRAINVLNGKSPGRPKGSRNKPKVRA